MAKISFIVTNQGTINAVTDNKSYTIPRDHQNYDKIKEAIKAQDSDALAALVNVAKKVENFTGNVVEVKDGVVHYKGAAIHNAVTDRILGLMREGFPFEPALKFLEKLLENPSRRAVNELYNFLEHRALPITEDGDFLAYKRVKEDWKDYHSGTFDNSVGKVCEVPRNMVDDDFRNDCSYGLHAGSIEYVRGFNSGGHIVIVKINPKDAVSVPSDANCTKLRTCRYEVIGEYTGDLTAPLYTNTGEPAARPSPFDATDSRAVSDDDDEYDDEEELYDEDEDEDEDDLDDEDVPPSQGTGKADLSMTEHLVLAHAKRMPQPFSEGTLLAEVEMPPSAPGAIQHNHEVTLALAGLKEKGLLDDDGSGNLKVR